MIPKHLLASHRPNPTTYGHPYGRPIVGIAEVSAWYTCCLPEPGEPTSSMTHTYHFTDGVIQTCRTVCYRTAFSVGEGRDTDNLHCVDTWDRPFRPDRGDFQISLNTCQRRYTAIDQIYAITRAEGGGDSRRPKAVKKLRPLDEEPAQVDSQLTLALPTLEPPRGYRKY